LRDSLISYFRDRIKVEVFTRGFGDFNEEQENSYAGMRRTSDRDSGSNRQELCRQAHADCPTLSLDVEVEVQAIPVFDPAVKLPTP
jgi:hypothetical protein